MLALPSPCTEAIQLSQEHGAQKQRTQTDPACCPHGLSCPMEAADPLPGHCRCCWNGGWHCPGAVTPSAHRAGKKRAENILEVILAKEREETKENNPESRRMIFHCQHQKGSAPPAAFLLWALLLLGTSGVTRCGSERRESSTAWLPERCVGWVPTAAFLSCLCR